MSEVTRTLAKEYSKITAGSLGSKEKPNTVVAVTLSAGSDIAERGVGSTQSVNSRFFKRSVPHGRTGIFLDELLDAPFFSKMYCRSPSAWPSHGARRLA
jgi:hypothetical protein